MSSWTTPTTMIGAQLFNTIKFNLKNERNSWEE